MGRKGPDPERVEECLRVLAPYGVSWVEAEVAVLLVQDWPKDADLAAALEIGERAVQKRLHGLREKVGGEDRWELARRLRQLLAWRACGPGPDEESGDESRQPDEVARQ